jgi:hypothetical protein
MKHLLQTTDHGHQGQRRFDEHALISGYARTELEVIGNTLLVSETTRQMAYAIVG